VRSVRFYVAAIGLAVHGGGEATARLGVEGHDLVVLCEDREAHAPGAHAQLFHLALLYPHREDLAAAVRRLEAAGHVPEGGFDLAVSENVYVADPDGVGLDLSVDRPREAWPPGGDVWQVGGPQRLDVAALAATVGPDAAQRPAGPDVRVGHVHLDVGDLAAALGFYRDVLGLEEHSQGADTVMLAIGDYHHHVALNAWRGEHLRRAPRDVIGLRHWTLHLHEDELDAIVARAVEHGHRPEWRDDGVLLRDRAGLAVLLATP
jgi:catechol 2,3-dioxygenase